MRLDDAADELYALDPGDFVARRGELAAQARADGDRGLAEQVASLGRPTVAAWLVNRLAAGADDDLLALLALGDEMRSAQRGLEGPRLKELSAERQRLVQRLVRSATQGRRASDTVRREVEATLVAAVADAAAAEAVASGHLTRALSYSGFGDVDLSAATALPPARRPATTPRHATTRRADARDAGPAAPPVDLAERREAKAAEARVTAAREALAAAEAATADAEARRRDAQTATEDLTRRASDLQRELADVRRQLAEATREAERAARSVENAERRARQAARDLESAARPGPPRRR